MWYLINSWILFSENPHLHLKNSTPPFLLTYAILTYSLSTPFTKIKYFSALLQKGKEGGHCVHTNSRWPLLKNLLYSILCWQLKNMLTKYASKIQQNLNLFLNTNVSTKNMYFSNSKFSYFIKNLDQ